MTTVVLGHPVELEQWLARRAELGQDRYDELWAGELHVVPGPSFEHAAVDAGLVALLGPLVRGTGLMPSTAFNLGRAGDYRVPDGGLHRGRPSGVYVPTAAMVIEVLSPDDETFAKLPFYAARGVAEVLVADPVERTVRLWQLRTDDGGAVGRYEESRFEESRFEETGRSDLLDVTGAQLAAELAWP